MRRALRLTIFVFVGLVGTFGLLLFGLRLVLLRWRPNPTPRESARVTITVQSAVIHPGSQLELLGHFTNAYDLGVNASASPFLSSLSRSVTGTIATVPLTRDDGAYTVAEMDPPRPAYTTTIGADCGVGFDDPPGPAPRTSLFSERFAVPDIPSGSYRLTVPPGHYCNGLPADGVTLEISIAP
jgi:hypothetical protein